MPPTTDPRQRWIYFGVTIWFLGLLAVLFSASIHNQVGHILPARPLPPTEKELVQFDDKPAAFKAWAVPKTAAPFPFDPTAARPPLVPTPKYRWKGLDKLAEYSAFHRAVRDQSVPGQREMLVWRIRSGTDFEGGFGNRILGAASAFLLSIAMNRAFFVLDSKLTDVFDPNVLYDNGNGIDWRWDTMNSKLEPWERDNAITLSVAFSVDETIGCKDIVDMYRNVPIIFVETHQFFLPLVTHNPHLRPKLVEWFGMGHDYIRHLVPLLFAPKPKLLAIVDELEWKHFAGKYVVGLQIRTEQLISADHEEQVFYSCADSIIAQYQDTYGINASQVLVYVASDSRDVHSRTKKHFSSSPVFEYKGNSSAIVDILMLSRASDIVITWPKSTFGVIAVAYSGNYPYTVMSGRSKRMQCVRQISTEACYHGWARRQALSCYNTLQFETPEMLNYDNCYYCDMPRCCPCEDEVPSDVCRHGSCTK